MKKTQLIAVLKTFDKKESKIFSKWLVSAVFNQREDVVILYKYLIQSNHLAEDKFLDKQRVFKKIFPSISFNDAKLRQTIHFLLQQVEVFLLFQYQNDDFLAQNLYLTKIYRERKVPLAFQRQMKITQKAFMATAQNDAQILRLEYELSDEYITFIKEQPKQVNVNIQESIDALDSFFIAEKLKQACHVVTYQKVFNLKYQIRSLDFLLSAVREDEYLLCQPAIAVYYHGYLMQVEKNENKAEEHYFFLREIIDQKFTSFLDNERRDIYIMALNFCIGRKNAGFQNFLREVFEMYKKGLESHVFIQEGILSSYTYLNISSAALMLKEFKWTKDFIDNYSPFLDQKHQDNFKQYTLARLLFDQKQYEEAMRLLVQFESKHILINLLAKSLLLKLYYEQDEFDALESLLDSFSIYLRRKEIVGSRKVNYLNIVKYTRKLLRLNPFDKEKRLILRKEITEANPLAEKPWLLEQIDKI